VPIVIFAPVVRGHRSFLLAPHSSSSSAVITAGESAGTRLCIYRGHMLWQIWNGDPDLASCSLNVLMLSLPEWIGVLSDDLADRLAWALHRHAGLLRFPKRNRAFSLSIARLWLRSRLSIFGGASSPSTRYIETSQTLSAESVLSGLRANPRPPSFDRCAARLLAARPIRGAEGGARTRFGQAMRP
jgi:hypothetical protein